MELQFDKNLKLLKNNEQIPENARCYGSLQAGGIGWGKAGLIHGMRWKRNHISSPSVIVYTEPGLKISFLFTKKYYDNLLKFKNLKPVEQS